MSALGLYLHIPFCSAICNYCNFNRGLFDDGLKTRYVGALEAEILAAGDGAAVDSVFFGGGTPSLLEPEEVRTLLAACRNAFAVAADAEVTLEANPESVTPAKLAGFRAAGVNRVSFGVQSFRDDELRRLSRLHSAARAVTAFHEARAAGFGNISLDLMMWLPAQTPEQWFESVDALIALGPDHASLYLLELYPNAPLREEMARATWSMAPDDDAADMYLESMERLERAGWAQYEISNVARPGRQSRHNLKYWTDGEWLGFGCGAHSTRSGARWKNVGPTEEYIGAIRQRGEASCDRRALSHAERVEDALFTGLRLTEGLDVRAMHARYGVDTWGVFGRELQPFVDHGVLIYDGARIALTRRGMLLANEVMSVFIRSTVR